MTKKELKAAQDSEIIMDFVRTHERIAVDSNLLGKPLKLKTWTPKCFGAGF